MENKPYSSPLSRQQPGETTEVYTWEFLPPGKRPPKPWVRHVPELRFHRGPRTNLSFHGKMPERLAFLADLRPLRKIYGMGKDSRYVGAQITPTLVIFENIEYGNGLYIIHGQWEDLSKRPRLELRKLPGVTYIVHKEGWQQRVMAIVRRHRPEPPESDALQLAA